MGVKFPENKPGGILLDERFYRVGLRALEAQMKQLRVERRSVGGKHILEYYDLFDAALKSLILD